MIRPLDSAFLAARKSPFLWRFTLFTRILLAAGFIPTGLVKAMGRPFTIISPETPIGAFFDAMHQTGMYWRFIGLTQIAAGVMLLLPRLAHLGAAVFLGIITNIFVITLSLGFRGTPVVTGLMLLAVVYLCMWDYNRFRPMLTTREPISPPFRHRLDAWERVGFALFALCFVAFFLRTRVLTDEIPAIATLVGAFVVGLLTAGRFFIQRVRGKLPTPVPM